MAPNNDVLPCTAGYLISLSTSVRLAIEALLISRCSCCKFVQTRCPTNMPIQYLFQSRNRPSVRPLGACVGLIGTPLLTPLITRTRYLPIISYQPSFSLRSASGAPYRPGESVMTHLTHSELPLFFLSTERIDESYIKAPTHHF